MMWGLKLSTYVSSSSSSLASMEMRAILRAVSWVREGGRGGRGRGKDERNGKKRERGREGWKKGGNTEMRGRE